jgi:hypothetical protein
MGNDRPGMIESSQDRKNLNWTVRIADCGLVAGNAALQALSDFVNPQSEIRNPQCLSAEHPAQMLFEAAAQLLQFFSLSRRQNLVNLSFNTMSCHQQLSQGLGLLLNQSSDLVLIVSAIPGCFTELLPGLAQALHVRLKKRLLCLQDGLDLGPLFLGNLQAFSQELEHAGATPHLPLLPSFRFFDSLPLFSPLPFRFLSKQNPGSDQ